MEDAKYNASEMESWTGGRWIGGHPAVIRGVVHDSRCAMDGMLFVALRGPRHDGHDYVNAVFGSGAAAALVSKVPEPLSGPCLLVDDTLKALQDLARGYRRKCHGRIIAVTGSAGKTTVKDMVLHLLRLAYKAAGTVGNRNNDIGLPLSLLAMPAACDCGVFEIGTNHPGELAVLCDILQPDWGILTAIGPAHIEFFGSVDAIAHEKMTVLRCLPEDGRAFFCGDNAYAADCRKATRAAVRTVAARGVTADYHGVLSSDGKAIMVEGPQVPAGMLIGWSGPRSPAHVCNVLLAAAVAAEAGVSWKLIGAELGRYAASGMRWQCRQAGAWRIINDAYNANPLSMAAALDALSGADECRTWLVLGDMLELGQTEEDAHRRLGSRIAQGAWRGLLAVGRRAQWIAAGAAQAGMSGRIECCDDAEQAAALLRQMLDACDTVFLKGSRGIQLEKVDKALGAGE